jgi:hypothetical protein
LINVEAWAVKSDAELHETEKLESASTFGVWKKRMTMSSLFLPVPPIPVLKLVIIVQNASILVMWKLPTVPALMWKLPGTTHFSMISVQAQCPFDNG